MPESTLKSWRQWPIDSAEKTLKGGRINSLGLRVGEYRQASKSSHEEAARRILPADSVALIQRLGIAINLYVLGAANRMHKGEIYPATNVQSD